MLISKKDVIDNSETHPPISNILKLDPNKSKKLLTFSPQKLHGVQRSDSQSDFLDNNHEVFIDEGGAGNAQSRTNDDRIQQ
jgi:hypothetical protein